MAVAKCQICGRNVVTTANNYRFINGIHQHVKCPQTSELTEEEKKDRKDLLDAINWLVRHQGKPKLSPAQWRKITSQIKRLCDDGYSYKDQLYAFKWYFDDSKKNEFKGYGIIEYIIEEALAEREENEQSKKVVNDMEAVRRYMEQKRRERLGLI